MENLNYIKDNSIVICDSVDETQSILNLKLKNIKIFTSSPAVILKFKSMTNIHYIESKWNNYKIREFQKDMKKVSSEIILLLKNNRNFEKEDILAICQFIWLFQRKIYKYSCIDDEVLRENVYCIKHKAKVNTFGDYINFDWKSLFENYFFTELERDFNDSSWDNYNLNKTGYIRRLKIAGLESVLYRLIIKFCKITSNILKFKKNIFIISDNPLIIQNSIKFFFKGYSLVILKDYNKKNKIDYDISKIPEEVFKILENHISKYSKPKISKIILSIFKNNITKYMEEHETRIEYFKNYFNNFSKCKNLIFNGTVSSLFVNSVSKAARQLNIPVYSFQHGVTLEIVEHYYDSSIRHEAINSNIYFSYNDAANNVVDQLEFKPNKSIIIGSSNRHKRIEHSKTNLNKKRVLYVSTNLYKGNLGFFYSYIHDLDQCKNEIFILENILNNIKSEVVYKTYPEINRRYVDTDPAILKSKKFNNIKLLQEKIDIRYIIKNYNIIISSGATSTLSWLLMSNLPLIFINNKNRLPFNPKLKETFKDCLFYFEIDEIDISKKIKNLLDKQIDEILHLWNMKKQKRDLFIKKYIFSENNKKLYNVLSHESL